MNVKILPLLLMVTIGLSSCAKYYSQKGNKAYDAMAYSNAISYYEKYLTRKTDRAAKIKLADSYRLINDSKKAEPLYAEVVSFPESTPVDMFNYAKVLMNQSKYEEAKVWLTKYLKLKEDDFAAEMLLLSCNTVDKTKSDTTLFTVKPVHMPDVSTAFGAVKYGDGIVFTADKEVKNQSKKSGWTGRSYLDLYYSQKKEGSEWENPQLLKGEINGEYHEGAATFNKEGDVVYFTRSNYFSKSKLAANSKNESNLKIFRAELKNGKWTHLEELGFNSDEYSCGHPTLSADGKSLYFISDMPGGLGGTDIYKTTLIEAPSTKPIAQSGPQSQELSETFFVGSSWTKPENLGPTINTQGNEMFPSIQKDGTLYFSSDKHNTLGGLDVFATTCSETKCLAPENMAYPLNSSKDDFAFSMNPENNTGYVSSNRDSIDRIFEVERHPPTFILTGLVRLKADNSPIADAVIESVNTEINSKEKTSTGADGMYKIKLMPNTTYTARSLKEGYFTLSTPINISTKDKKKSETFSADFILDRVVLDKPIVLENIYYDLDKWAIRADAAKELDKLVSVMNDNPKITIELGSHTDSRAGDSYNQVLSEKRAKAAVEYLIKQGVGVKRMKWKGYGETVLVNGCKNDAKCVEEEHQKNRRTEFKVIKIDK